ncbi:hypothetical protein CPC08DRAFT_821905 [Agrocybe pediades]|nr:hypothetical protein CPC08DRAFT_821905 [Agrocybe pediades]
MVTRKKWREWEAFAACSSAGLDVVVCGNNAYDDDVGRYYNVRYRLPHRLGRRRHDDSQKPKKEQYVASASSSPPSSSNLPPLAKGKGSSSATKSSASLSATTTKGSSSKAGRKQVPVPVPSVRLPAPPPQEHYPFPVTAAPPDDTDDDSFASNWETSPSVGAPRYTRDGRTRNVLMKGGAQAQGQGQHQHQHQHRMHNACARDGGRTHSGGVKGILTDS